MRVGPPVGKKTTAGEVVTSARDGWAVGLLTTVSMISVFPQGLISIGFIVSGSDDSPDWFLALHLSSPWNLLVAVGFVALGLYVGWLALKINPSPRSSEDGRIDFWRRSFAHRASNFLEWTAFKGCLPWRRILRKRGPA